MSAGVKATPRSWGGREIAAFSGLLAVLVAVYAQVTDHGFVNYDDQVYLAKNAVVSHGLSWSAIGWAFTTTTLGNWFPATWISHILDVQLFGLAPRGHHLTSLAIHAANVCLLWIWLRGMTGAFWRSALVASLFALHPINVESVAWVAERKNVLSTLGLLGALIAYVRYVRRPGPARYAAVFLLMAASLLAKAMAVTLPLLLLLLDVWPLGRLRLPGHGAGSGRPGSAADRVRRVLLEKFPLLLLSGASSIVTYRAQAGSGYVEMLQDLTPMMRLANAGVSTLAYLRKAVWPADLACFYPHPEATLPLWQGLLAIAVLVAVAGLLLIAGRQRPFLAVGWLWFLVSLAPVLGLIQVGWQAMADRYAYVPLIGVFVAASWALAGAAPRGAVRRLPVAALAVLALVGCAATTHMQAGYWRDTLVLFEHALAVTERNWFAHSSLGGTYAERGDLTRGMAHMREAMRLNGRYALKSERAAPAAMPPGHPPVQQTLPPGHPRR